MLDRVHWDDEGWPVVYNGHPSEVFGVPTIE